MTSCQCHGIERFFSDRVARRELKRYRRRGPLRTTRLLVEALEREGIRDLTLLDIGGGIGAIQHELLEAGASRATDVDGSIAYLRAAREESERRGSAGRVDYHHGDFVELAPSIEAADIVTLDRVICCYDDVRSLVALSAARAQRLYGLVYPREALWIRAGFTVINWVMRLRRSPFRVFVHSSATVEETLRAEGFDRRFYRHGGPMWRVAVYVRSV
jgi:Methyltransferase domain